MMETQFAAIGTRIDALAASRRLWLWVILIAAGGFFEIYDLALTAPLSSGLVAAGIFHVGRAGMFGLADQATFISATFVGLYLGVVAFAVWGDRLGRKRVFGWSLLWYALATLVMGWQTDMVWLCFWRFVAGIGVGAEAVAIDCYVVEIVPARMRGRAFSVSMCIQYLAIPFSAFLAAFLIPHTVAGLAGWRWLTIVPALGALAFWFVRRGIPESPRWLASRGRFAEAHAILDQLPALPMEPPPGRAWREPQRRTVLLVNRAYVVRVTIMMLVYFNLQNIAYYAFSNWLPTLLESQGVPLKQSLFYSAGVALAAPVAPLILSLIADRFERKYLIIASGLGSVVLGLLFASTRAPLGWLSFGIGLALVNSILSVNSHNYLSEIFPTSIRARAVGFVYSFTRLAAALGGYLIAYILAAGGTRQVFIVMSLFMIIALAAIAALGPRTRHVSVEDIEDMDRENLLGGG